jgi:hypothetical protein
MGHRVTTLNVNTIEPAGSTLTIGASGDTVVLADDVKANTYKDAGGGYKYAAFTDTGANTWTCPTGVTSAEILVVAGGGGGTNEYYGGGGGAGGIVHATAYTVVPAVVYDITVGGGGAIGTNGSDSVWNVNAEGSGIAFTAKGGGYGGGSGASGTAGGAGGSGGGSDNDSSAAGGSSTQTSFSGATSYGSAGGRRSAMGQAGGGGGGATETPGTSSPYPPGDAENGINGGAGKLFSNFTDYGVDGYFGGGGGGGAYTGSSSALGGIGGVGGGGKGGGYGSGKGSEAGIANTGGGGGSAGGSHSSGDGTGKVGGSGVVLIRYVDPTPNTLWTSNGSGVLSSVNTGFGDALKLLSTQTASNSASLSFTSAITGAFTTTYKEYIFKFININPATNLAEFSFQGSINAGSSYGVTITSSAWHTYGHESSGATGLEYQSTNDLAQATGFQHLCNGLGNGADESLSGEFHLFNPASTTFAKQWFARCQLYQASDYSEEFNVAGYFNDVNNIDAIQFKMNSGNFDGKIKMYGVK